MRACVATSCAALAMAGLVPALAGCGEEDSTVSPEAPRTPLDRVRALRKGEDRYGERPASCHRVHGVVIAARRPEPATLRVRPGDCVYWGNRAESEVRLRSTGDPPRISGNRAVGALFKFAMTIDDEEAANELLGPFTRLTPAEAFAESRKGGEGRPYPYGADRQPVEVEYTVSPGGAKGTIVLLPTDPVPSRSLGGRLASSTDALRSLRRGDREIDDRPALCEVTHGVLIAGGRARPPTLRAERGDCVIWGNREEGTVKVSSDIDCDIEERLGCTYFSRAIRGGAAADAVGPLTRTYRLLKKNHLTYTIEPGGRKGTIVVR